MKAILKFKDGPDRIASVPTSEDEAGDVYILEQYEFKGVKFQLAGIRGSDKSQWAEYVEIDDPKKSLTLVKSG